MEVLFERLTGERWQGLINDGYEYLHMKGISRIEVGGKEVSCFFGCTVVQSNGSKCGSQLG